MDSHRIVTQSSPRHESIEKVTGVEEYTDDLDIPGIVYAVNLTSKACMEALKKKLVVCFATSC